MKRGLGGVAGMLCALPLLWPGAAHALLFTCTAEASVANFGAYSPFDAAALDGVGNARVTCTGLIGLLVSYDIQLSRGASGSYAARSMSNGIHALSYNLYTSAARATVWGDGSGGSSTVSDGYLLAILTTVRDYPVYGRIGAGQNVSPGAYADTIVVTVNY